MTVRDVCDVLSVRNLCCGGTHCKLKTTSQYALTVSNASQVITTSAGISWTRSGFPADFVSSSGSYEKKIRIRNRILSPLSFHGFIFAHMMELWSS